MSEARPSALARLLAVALLLASGAGLEMQAELFIARDGLAGLWRQAGFFTAWSNLAAFLLAALTLAAPAEAGPRLRLVVTAALLAIWIGYGELFHGHGSWTAERMTFALLHDVTPLLSLALWLARPHGALSRRALLAAVGFPAVFLVIAMARRIATGWVPYDFLGLEGGALSLALASVLAIVGSVAALLMLADRLWPQGATAAERT